MFYQNIQLIKQRRQAMKSNSTTKFIGLDVHSKTISVAIADEGRKGEVRHYGTIENTTLQVICNFNFSDNYMRICKKRIPWIGDWLGQIRIILIPGVDLTHRRNLDFIKS
jgi:hypothetical protein